jgi:uncharacterized membrane protein
MSNDNNAERTGNRSSLTQDVVTTVATVGVIAAGVALLEVALIPGMVIGGAAVLAPNLLPKSLTMSLSLRGLRRRLKPLLDFSPPIASKASSPKFSLASASSQNLPVVKPALPVQFTIKQAIAKTITYRIIVTTLDFTVNYLVIGEVATAAGLSAFALVVGPLFYLGHEAVWNRFGDADKRVDLTALFSRRPDDETLSDETTSEEMSPLGRANGDHDQPGAGQDDHVPYHRDHDGFYDQFRGGRRSRDGADAVGLGLYSRAFRLFRPRNGMGLLWFVRRTRAGTGRAHDSAAGARLALSPEGSTAFKIICPRCF